jgi:bla regulator protein blaR1
MQLLFTGSLFTGKIIQALYWTFIHSLWQGLLLGILAAITITFTKRSRPVLRYNLLATFFFLFIVAAGFTFTRQLFSTAETGKTAAIELPTVTNPQSNFNGAALIAGPETGDGGQNMLSRLADYFNTHAGVVVSVWFIIFIIKGIRIFANLGYIQRMKSHKTHSPSAYWKARIAELAEQLQIKKTVTLLESEIVKVPVMAGFFKPIILVPFCMLSQLPADQAEAILLHELAHIKRKDYFVNLLQHFAEIIFFFNPAILWVSSLIRDERENCCDDMAIGETKDKQQFITALLSFQEFNAAPVKYVLPFPGKKNHLMCRVKRIIYNENKKLNAMEKGMLVFSLATAILLSTIASKDAQAQTRGIVQEIAVKNINDTIPAKDIKPAGSEITDEADNVFTNISTATNDNNKIKTRTITATARDGKIYKLVELNNKLTGLYINGRKIPAEKIEGYQAVINHITAEARIREEKGAEDAMAVKEKLAELMLSQSEHDKLQHEKIAMMENELAAVQKQKHMSLLDEQMKLKDEKLFVEKALQEKLFNLGMDQKQRLMTLQEKLFVEKAMQEKLFNLAEDQKLGHMELVQELQMQEKLSQMSAGQNKLPKEKLKAMEAYERKLSTERMKLMELDQHKLSEEKMQLMQLYQHKLQEEARMGSEEMKMNTDKMRQQRLMEFIAPVIEDLANENVIQDKNDLSFTLNNDELIVNGIKQPAELHRKLREKYIRNPKDQFIYTQKNDTRSMTIQVY